MAQKKLENNLTTVWPTFIDNFKITPCKIILLLKKNSDCTSCSNFPRFGITYCITKHLPALTNWGINLSPCLQNHIKKYPKTVIFTGLIGEKINVPENSRQIWRCFPNYIQSSNFEIETKTHHLFSLHCNSQAYPYKTKSISKENKEVCSHDYAAAVLFLNKKIFLL